jgi:hypothetical protein
MASVSATANAPLIDIFCDESCHLQNDGQSAMVIGGVWAHHDSIANVSRALRELKKRHKLSPQFELKWSKVSPARLQFYLDAVD